MMFLSHSLTAAVRLARHACRFALVAGSALSAAVAGSPRIPGFVDGSAFTRVAGDDSVKAEVSLSGGLLHALAGADQDLGQLTSGLESIHAVILDISDAQVADKAQELIRKIEKDLLGSGWERLARVVDARSEVKVLLLNDETSVQGLVVMIVNREDSELVFANVAGKLDLAAISRIGEDLDIPGLESLEHEEDE